MLGQGVEPSYELWISKNFIFCMTKKKKKHQLRTMIGQINWVATQAQSEINFDTNDFEK